MYTQIYYHDSHRFSTVKRRPFATVKRAETPSETPFPFRDSFSFQRLLFLSETPFPFRDSFRDSFQRLLFPSETPFPFRDSFRDSFLGLLFPSETPFPFRDSFSFQGLLFLSGTPFPFRDSFSWVQRLLFLREKDSFLYYEKGLSRKQTLSLLWIGTFLLGTFRGLLFPIVTRQFFFRSCQFFVLLGQFNCPNIGKNFTIV